ncbi:hypothetical protein Q8G35_27540 [Peribacillus simplex]|uniref:Uncharacterized protein n=2 Tax=Peribacillus TaxID=2675229 RepID=A0AA90PJ79_9BACI|nr:MULTISPECIES: hypothetical protein [Peribacillus]MDP1422007.1 hypothetical protein [Peribacillus simplex]MDP1454682.1 hypothetical protein [Peribacillus frigoritolerans]
MSKEVYMIGEIRTNNFSDKDLFKKIGLLWRKTNDHHVENEMKYGIYHQYESTIVEIIL